MALCLGSVALFAACLPEPHDLVGRPCDAEHPCPNDLHCVRSVCSENLGFDNLVPDAGSDAGASDAGRGDASFPAGDGGAPVNLARNGSFEAGLTEGWETRSDSVVAVSDSVSRTGARSLLVQPVAGFTGTWGVRNEQVTLGTLDAGLSYCAEAFLQRAPFSSPLEVQLLLRAYDAANNFGTDSPSNRLALPDNGWVRHTAKLAPVAPFTARLSVRMSSDGTPDGGYFVDDVRIWTDPTGLCP